jgi:hypothetical protein
MNELWQTIGQAKRIEPNRENPVFLAGDALHSNNLGKIRSYQICRTILSEPCQSDGVNRESGWISVNDDGSSGRLDDHTLDASARFRYWSGEFG